MKYIAVLVLMVCSAVYGQVDSSLAPRSSLLTGTANRPSARGAYVITWPPPNECVHLSVVEAPSRSAALYIAVSRGGFTLLPGSGGLTVWTVEEWDELSKSIPQYVAQMKEHCRTKPSDVTNLMEQLAPPVKQK